MSDDPRALIEGALRGERPSIRALVHLLTPVIQARIVRGLSRRRRAAGGRDVRQEVEDMTQDVFAMLFAHDGKVLRSWDEERGMGIVGFVGLVAERHVASMMRSGRRNPWKDTPEELDTLEHEGATDEGPMARIESRAALSQLLDRLRESLSPRGLELFHRLYVRQEPIAEVARSMEMTREAIYAWRNRVTKVLSKLAAEISDDAALDSEASPRRDQGSGSE